MRILLGLSCLMPLPLQAEVPMVKAQAETTPIPAGFSDSDDAAIWRHPKDPEKSLILGTSKYDEDGQGGLGVYALDGRELQFFPGAKLNSVDLIGNLAIATNRSENALDIYRVEQGLVRFVSRTLLTDAQGQSFEPYGLCLQKGRKGEVIIHLPTKTGTLYQYALDDTLEVRLRKTLDLSAFVSAEQDARIRSHVTKETLAEGEEEELEENLEERFILEGCVVDTAEQKLYVGMENLGIWSIDIRKTSAKPKLIIPVQGSWTDIESWQEPGTPRVTDDIEGLDIIRVEDRSYLLFSSQGISEFTLYDLEDLLWKGNFKITWGTDPITLTDGLAVKGGDFGSQYPEGILVVHDDENTDEQGNTLPANYKLVSLADVWSMIPLESDDSDDEGDDDD